jgi:hypothetical protein
MGTYLLSPSIFSCLLVFYQCFFKSQGRSGKNNQNQMNFRYYFKKVGMKRSDCTAWVEDQAGCWRDIQCLSLVVVNKKGSNKSYSTLHLPMKNMPFGRALQKYI